MPRIALEELERLVRDALERNGTERVNATAVARALAWAEADGLKGHGVSRVSSYVEQLRAGKVDGKVEATATRTAHAALLIDARHGFAYPALDLAIKSLPDLARESGVAAAGITRSHHCGAAGHHVERLADMGFVALLFANTPSAIAPWGGHTAVFGTNPIAFACPCPGDAPIVADLSLSKVARGNIVAAQKRGEPIPDDWALDANGQPTTDPALALAGTMRPAGDAKGTVLALIVEVLAAGLTGANYAAEASSFLDAAGGPPGTGQLLIAFDPEAFGGDPSHFAHLAGMITTQAGARLPGRRRQETRRRAISDGLDLPAEIIAEIESL